MQSPSKEVVIGASSIVAAVLMSASLISNPSWCRTLY
jgi:hypothetical protein